MRAAHRTFRFAGRIVGVELSLSPAFAVGVYVDALRRSDARLGVFLGPAEVELSWYRP